MKEDRAKALIGRELGPYRILSLLGVGGMGEVYLARDKRLGRDVAIKVLPQDLASDPERRNRFEREARLLAALNHPHIATLYGVEDEGGVAALVLEWIEGPTLADRLAGGALSVREALACARQIAGALESAHEKGIVHRDLKPGNIKMTAAGAVKVLDFGLAKVTTRDGSNPDLSQTPTLSGEGTRDGIVLGTAGYMSPEQARGLAVDKRTDLWAFGCVLYEMLTARKAFSGETLSDTLAAVLRAEPDWTLLPESTPPILRRLLRRCLEKDPAKRLRDAADAGLDLDEALAPAADAGGIPQERASQRRGWPSAAWVVAIAIPCILGALAWLSTGNKDPLPVTRTTVTLPSNQALDAESGAAPLALSSDGLRLVYVARSEGSAQLYLRNLDAFEAQPVAGTENARYPFFSPDGAWIGFFADGKLKRVSVGGGAPIPVCDAPLGGRGALWGPDGTIVFDGGDLGLLRVNSEGGRPEPLTVRNEAIDPRNLEWPRFLPGGRALITTLHESRPAGDEQVLAVVSIDGDVRVLGPVPQAEYLPPNYLVFHAPQLREGALHAARFDLDTWTLKSTAVSVLDGVFRARGGGGAYFAVSQNGTLVFAPGGLAHTLVRVDRSGRRTPLSKDRRGFRFPRISPDGHRVAVTIDPRPSEIWIYDLARQSRVPLMTEGHNILPVWRRDGRRIDFSFVGDVYSIPADGSAAAEPLLAAVSSHSTRSGGRRTVAFSSSITSLRPVPMSGYCPISGEPRRLVSTPARETNGAISPASDWLAYNSDESGRFEVYVRPFPNVDSGKWMVSTTGGHTPLWSPDGRELFYMNGAAMMAVPLEVRGAEFVPGEPAMLFDGPFDTTQDLNYDVAPDGSYFVMVEADPDARPTRLQVVLNWSEELK